MGSLSDLKVGKIIVVNAEPYEIVANQHIKVARGGAVVKTKLKNLVSGNTLEKSFSGSDSVELADTSRRHANYLYVQGDDYFFMDSSDFEQFQFSKKDLGDKSKYLKEGQEVDVMVFNDKPVSVSLPSKINLKVVSAADGVKGNSAGAVTKPVTLETGLEIRTPLFIKSGDILIINTETGEYVSRA
jgi:elongation factor P